MPNALLPLTTDDELTAVVARSSVRPVLVFKHSETCGMSFVAREEVLSALADPAWDTDVHLVLVQRSRALSQAITDRLRVRHASPQILLLAEGEVRWQASHLSITADALRKAVARH